MTPSPNKQAFGLLEVLIVLAIVATTMVSASQLAVTSYRSIVRNEVTDYATGLALQALEIAKSPNDVKVSNASATNFNGTYRLNLAVNPPVLYQQSTNQLTAPTTCASNSAYSVPAQTTINGVTPLTCVFITINQAQNLGLPFYKITATVIYNYVSQTDTQTVVGYRRGTFTL